MMALSLRMQQIGNAENKRALNTAALEVAVPKGNKIKYSVLWDRLDSYSQELPIPINITIIEI
ncbi:hypothetical protein LAG90_04945 [Marinilongibacter aquaticus]|uniref:hypothetical protein n=1 Tax=Marinilongibacter aquaticus TaxID=2975157 RepID=UPI0021BDC34D|nr:hypothetical protein [Marinilongibacter aquaticus]UBM59996.1 hypothetical protein LAG90_04945 [Marinilongibacter aquaticus]